MRANPHPHPDGEHWMVTRWPEGACRYEVLSVHPTRDAAMAAAALDPRAQLVFCAVLWGYSSPWRRRSSCSRCSGCRHRSGRTCDRH
jgi:hypothetical protein